GRLRDAKPTGTQFPPIAHDRGGITTGGGISLRQCDRLASAPRLLEQYCDVRFVRQRGEEQYVLRVAPDFMREHNFPELCGKALPFFRPNGTNESASLDT